MDFLMAMLSPTLSKVLEVCFLTGYVTAYRLEAARKLRGGVPHLPRLSSRTRPARTFSTGSTGKVGVLTSSLISGQAEGLSLAGKRARHLKGRRVSGLQQMYLCGADTHQGLHKVAAQ